MEGGIRAWEGLTATGAPEAGMAYFPESASTEDLIALAWLLEDGSRRFYRQVPDLLPDAEAGKLFRDLSASEEVHEAMLAGLYKYFTNREFRAEAHPLVQKAGGPGEFMEGGVRVDEALAWAKDRNAPDVLDLAIALETNSYDLYIKMGRRVTDNKSKEVFLTLSSGEKNHLERLASLLERKV